MADDVLVLEDDPELADLLQGVLEDAGYGVSVTPSGKDALLRFARNPFDLVVADLQVHDLSGLGVWHVIHDLAQAPVVAMSASRSPWQDQAFQAGATACLPKPFGADTLLSLTRSLLPQADHRDSFPADVRELPEEDLERIRSMSDEELDALPFGLIQVDENGIIRGYNAYEARAAGLAAESVIGLPFADVAPCTTVKEFASRIDEAAQDPGRSVVLRFRFPRRTATSIVSIRLFKDPESGLLWIFVSQRQASP